MLSACFAIFYIKSNSLVILVTILQNKSDYGRRVKDLGAVLRSFARSSSGAMRALVTAPHLVARARALRDFYYEHCYMH